MAMNEINLLLDLFTEDIVHTYIFPKLTVPELLNLLQINNKNLQNIVVEYIKKMKIIKFYRNVDEVINRDYSPRHVTPEQIKIFHDNCRNLRELDLRGCHWLTNKHFLPFLWANQETLETVQLDGCLELSQMDILHLILCRNLSYVAYNHVRFEREGGPMDYDQKLEFVLFMIIFNSCGPYTGLPHWCNTSAKICENFRWDEEKEHEDWDVERRIKELEMKKRDKTMLIQLGAFILSFILRELIQ